MVAVKAKADVSAPKVKDKKKPMEAKPGKTPGPKLIPNNLTPPPAGSNSGAHPGLQKIVDEIMFHDEKKKEHAKCQRDLRNQAKTEYDVQAGVLAHEIKLRKMANDARVQFESGHSDLKGMLGYQAALDLKPGTTARTEEEYVDPSVKAREGDLITREG